MHRGHGVVGPGITSPGSSWNQTANRMAWILPAYLLFSRLDLSAMAPSVQKYFRTGLASSHQKTYRAALKRFHSFCTKFNIKIPFQPGPSTPDRYHVCQQVRNMQISLGLPDRSSLPVLKRVQAGIKKFEDDEKWAIYNYTPDHGTHSGADTGNSRQVISPPLWSIACTAFFLQTR